MYRANAHIVQTGGESGWTARLCGELVKKDGSGGLGTTALIKLHCNHCKTLHRCYPPACVALALALLFLLLFSAALSFCMPGMLILTVPTCTW